MPELPDVEGFFRMAARATGRRIERVEVADARILRNTSPQGLGRALKGSTLERPRRHGKWLFLRAGGPTVVLHFGMTGGLRYDVEPEERDREDKVVLRLDRGELRFRSRRILGGLWLARSDGELGEITGPLGPDALGLGRRDLEELLERRRGALKPALTDQALLAGVGNELSDEILWQARLNPRRPVSSLEKAECARLHGAMRKVLRESARRGIIPRRPSWLTGRVRGDGDEACPRCGSDLVSGKVGGRTSWWCPRCQPRS